jgi:hypothetical protein
MGFLQRCVLMLTIAHAARQTYPDRACHKSPSDINTVLPHLPRRHYVPDNREVSVSAGGLI